MAISEISKIVKAFPALSEDFVDLLFERAIAKGFTQERFVDSVNNVIDNCQYPSPTLANFLSFDKRVSLLNYNQVCNLVANQEDKFENYVRVLISGKSFWISSADQLKYNIPTEI